MGKLGCKNLDTSRLSTKTELRCCSGRTMYLTPMLVMYHPSTLLSLMVLRLCPTSGSEFVAVSQEFRSKILLTQAYRIAGKYIVCRE